MLSVGSRDGGRKRSVLGLEGRGVADGRQMEENELEEGEAYYGQDEDIDPDDLSYIDEKLQHVLGHFQKEFEGGVSAETLGAKFGGYGSFLPAYQRSPPVMLSHSKSPLKMPNQSMSKSPHNLQPENASVFGNASTTKANGGSVIKPTEKSSKRDSSISLCHTEGIPQDEFTRQTLDIRDPKSLKVRIKVGPDNVLIRNKPEIYSDLGLDVSPSPSLEDSPGGSRELSPESPDAFVESPSTILQVMTRFLVPGSYLLSPLSETLLHLSDKEDTLITNIKKNTPQNVMPENCTASSTTSLHAKNVRDFTYKENKYREKCQKLIQGNGQNCVDVITTRLKNEIERKPPVLKEVISSTHEMVLPSSAWCADTKEEMHLGGNFVKENSNIFDIQSEENKIPMTERVQTLDLRKDNHVEFIDSRIMDGADNLDKEIVHAKGKPYSESHFIEKEVKEINGNFDNARNGKFKSQKNLDTKKSDADKQRMGINFSSGFEELVKEQPTQKTCSSENKLMQDKDQSFEDGKMIKGSKNEALFIEPSKEKHSALFSVAPKGKKKMLHVKGSHVETKPKTSKMQKENKHHNTESQSELLLSAQVQQIESRTHALSSSVSIDKSKEKTIVNKADNFHIAGAASDAPAPLIDVINESDPVSAIPAVVLIEDNWVCCDICQRWRLLPYGTKPESLPKKWHCSMQVWLPGLNNCNVRESDTTKAFHELYQFSAPGGDTNVTAHLSAAASSITSADPMNPGRRLDNVMHNAPQNGKKKLASTDATNLPNDSSLTNLPNPLKNSFPSSGNKDFNDVSYCTETDSLSKPMPGWTSRSMNISAEKHVHKQKRQHTSSSSFKVGDISEGNFSERSDNYLKPMSKRGTDVDGRRTSKKLKKDDSYHLLKDLHTGIDATGNMAANGDSELLAKAPKNILQNHSGHSSKDLNSKSGSSKKSREEINSSNGQLKEISGASEAEKSWKYDSNDKKRKLKEWQERQSCQGIPLSSERIAGSRFLTKEALINGELRRQKKTKVAKSEGKESRAVIGGGNIDMKGCSTRITLSSNRKHPPVELDNDGIQAATDEQLLHYQGDATSGQALDCLDGLKRDVTYIRSLAATSSSSKVSGSQKGKVSLLETRGSPVESVSSSPMRILSAENNSARRNSLLKDNAISMGYSGMGSPKRFSDGEFDGSSDQSGTRAKDPSSNDCLRSSEIYRSAESGVLNSLKRSHDYEDTETRRLTGVRGTDGRHSKSIKRDDVNSNNINKANIVCDSSIAPQHPKNYHVDRSDKYPTCDENEHCGSGQKEYVKSSLHSGEKLRSSNSDKGKLKISGTVTEHRDLHSYRTCNSRPADTEFDNLNSHKKINLENYSKQQKAHELRASIAGESQSKPTSQQNLQRAPSHEMQKPPGLLIAEATNRSVLDLGKGMQSSNQAKEKLEKMGLAPQTTPESTKGGDALKSESFKSAKQSRKLDEQNGTLPNLLSQPITNLPGSSSPMKKGCHPNVNIFIKEARDLKHTATRLKGLGLEDESCGIFFESALKFLHAAFLLEPSNVENTKQGEMVPSTQALLMYYDTAKYCEFCAHEYERLKEMAAAALAYKCAEVAYLKVAYYKHSSASKDRLELQIALDAPMPGESPSSSASDVDNLNTQGGVDKVASTRTLNSPHIASNRAIAARNRPHVKRLLTYTNYLSCAFEATKKSQNALAAASTNLRKSGIDICSAKKALDFNFHNVEGLLRLVRVSMNSTGH